MLQKRNRLFLLKKRELSKNKHKNKLSLITEADEPQISSFVKPRRSNNFILKFQILKQKLYCYHQSQPKENEKNNKIFLQKNLKQKLSKFNLLLEYLLRPYTHPIIYPKCIGSRIQNTGKPNKLLSSWLCVDMASIMVSWHTCYNLVKVLSTEFLWRG